MSCSLSCIQNFFRSLGQQWYPSSTQRSRYLYHHREFHSLAPFPIYYLIQYSIDSEGLKDVKDNSTRGEDSLGCTEVSGGSWVVNGDVKDKSNPYSARSHIMKGGKVTRESRLVNGDMDPDTFIEAFCRPR